MDDEAYVAELLAILTNPNPSGIDPDDPYGRADDGIDRYGGFGRDVWVTSLAIDEGEYGLELVVGFGLTVPVTGKLKGLPPAGTVALPFDHDWRMLSGYGTAAAYAPEVAQEVESAVHTHVEQFTRPEPAPDPRDLPPRDVQWQRLLDVLATEGAVREVGPGRIEVEVEHGGAVRVITVVMNPDQWEAILRKAEYPYVYVEETISSRDDDELFLVVFRGRMEMSIREQLPPVRGTATKRFFDGLRADNPDADFGWRA